ncbi:hypothetical protein ACA910_007133 [Epithemia clementina (nom. ined.)]
MTTNGTNNDNTTSPAKTMAVSSSLSSSSSSKDDLTARQALTLADSLYVDEAYADAVDAYTAAQTLLQTTTTTTSSSTPTTTTDPVCQFCILSHRSAAFYQLQRYQEALEDAQAANEITAQQWKTMTTTMTTTTTTTGDVTMTPHTTLSLRPGETEIALR